jgi:SNF2 family DNA or RNA helicase
MIVRTYQTEAIRFLVARQFALLALEMRLGKTMCAILAAQEVGAKEIVVVCPAIAVAQWEQEFRKWWPDTAYRVFSYDKARVQDWSTFDQFDVAIIDECHFAKNPDAQRTKAIFGKDGLGWHTDRMWCLSGTPATRHAGELWPMLFAFGVTTLTYESFCRTYCTYDWTHTKITGTKVAKIPEIKAMLAKIMLRRTRKEVAPEMDEISFSFLAIDSKTDLTSELETDPSRKEVAKAKAPALVEEIAECIERGDYKQTVAFGWHREAIFDVRAGLAARGIKAATLIGGMHESQRTAVQQQFRAGEIQVVVAQIIAAGTAIDLSAASHGYFLELDWLPANNVQAANRLVSLMKSEPVTFDICTVPGSIDEKVQKILLRRARELKELV